jgi:hypothetical protein
MFEDVCCGDARIDAHASGLSSNWLMAVKPDEVIAFRLGSATLKILQIIESVVPEDRTPEGGRCAEKGSTVAVNRPLVENL